MHSHVIYICTRVAVAAEEVVYEVVAEPQGPAPQEEVRGSRPKAQLTLVLSSRRKANPGATPIISNYNTYICLYYLCIRCRNFLEP